MSAYEILIVINICIALGIVGGCIVLATMKIADCIMSYKDWREQKREIIELRKRWLENHQDALEFGVQYKEVFIERMVEND